jgi:hypothetical protein
MQHTHVGVIYVHIYLESVQYTWQAETDARWARYYPMTPSQFNDSWNLELEFQAMYVYASSNRLYGFADYNRCIAGQLHPWRLINNIGGDPGEQRPRSCRAQQSVIPMREVVRAYEGAYAFVRRSRRR